MLLRSSSFRALFVSLLLAIVTCQLSGDRDSLDSVYVEYEANDEVDDKSSPEQEDIVEAADFGLRAMHDLYDVEEPKLYSMGLYLGADEPARYVAAFNHQTEEARKLAKFGYALLEAATMFVVKFPDASRSRSSLLRSAQGTRLQKHCPKRGIPRCPPASARYRTSDGSCNNRRNPWWGSAMSTMQRFLPAVYGDGVQSVRRSKSGRPLPSARRVSELIHEDRDVPLASVTHMLMQWGQFVDHDLTATGQSRGFNGSVPRCCLNNGVGFQPPEFTHPECLAIEVDPRDSFFGPLGVRCLEFVRSGAAPREDCQFGPREQLSQVTGYLDASAVYSSSALQSDSLRLFRNGLLQYGKLEVRKPLLPREDSDLCKRGSLSTSCFRAGDGRLSEQPALTSLHVIFLRLHNRLATKLAALNSHWSDEKLYQETRRIVGAILQHITYREFLPIVLGRDVMKIFDLEVRNEGYYDGYDPSVNPTVANSFSTAAYRFGHSLVQRSFMRFDEHHRPLVNNVTIHEEFSNRAALESAGSVDRMLLGLVNQPAQKRDEFLTTELTRHLFQTPRFHFGMDLAALNIQRGRDHGIPPYVDWRQPCGLSPIEHFDDLEKHMPSSTVKKLRALYSHVEDIDLYAAGLAEYSLPGALVGPTFGCIIAQQFSNVRRGDRFWYENAAQESAFSGEQLQQIRKTTLASLLCMTTDSVKTIQPFVFLTPDTLRNRRVPCDDRSMYRFDLKPWIDEKSAEERSGQVSNSGFQATKTSADSNEQRLHDVPTFRRKPVKASINQQNRIIVKNPFGRPVGAPDNVTIIVQNNAVNSPVFVSDSIYGSHVQIGSTTEKLAAPIRSESTRNPYVPHGHGDPSNPNPLDYGFTVPDEAPFNEFFNSPQPNGASADYDKPKLMAGSAAELPKPLLSFNTHGYNYYKRDATKRTTR